MPVSTPRRSGARVASSCYMRRCLAPGCRRPAPRSAPRSAPLRAWSPPYQRIPAALLGAHGHQLLGQVQRLLHQRVILLCEGGGGGGRRMRYQGLRTWPVMGHVSIGRVAK